MLIGKFITYAMAALFVCSCGLGPQRTSGNTYIKTQPQVETIIDEVNDNICYVLWGSHGISCLKLQRTK